MAANEILVRDKNGKWRVWKDGQWLETTPPAGAEATPVEQPAMSSAIAAAPQQGSSVQPPQATVSKLLNTTAAVSESVEVSSVVNTPAEQDKSDVATAQSTADNFQRSAESIVTGLNLTNLAPELQPRLVNTIRLRLKDVRDTVDTRETLRRAPSEGGVGLTEEAADQVIASILEVMPKLGETDFKVGADTPTKIEPPVSPAPLEALAVLESQAPVPTVQTEAPARSQAEPQQPTQVAEIQPQKILSQPPQKALPVEPVIKNPSMIDVRTRPAVVGPIDELRLFTVVDFRRLDPDPRRAADRLHGKIKLLEDESYDKMMEGVKAWRVSPLYGLYLEIGHDSLIKNQPISQIIKGRQDGGQEFLSNKEFEAIMDLNKSLRF